MITPDDNITSDYNIITLALAPDDNIASQMITFNPR
jgi:hypothetical protein